MKENTIELVKECPAQFQVHQSPNKANQQDSKGPTKEKHNGASKSKQEERDMKEREETRKNDELCQMLKLIKIKKVSLRKSATV